MFVLALAGCGTVNPEADYARTGTLVRDRTGAQGVYDPKVEEAIQARVNDLLADGLTADEAVSLALLNNKAFQSQFQDIGVSRADLVQSGLFTNPTLTFSARLLEGGGRANVSFGLAQDLVDLWQIPVRKRIAKDKLERTILAVTKSAIDLAARARSAYFQVLIQQATETVVKENLDLLQHTLELTQRRFDAGETTILDVNLVRSSVLDGTMRLATTRKDLQIARAALEHVLGLSVEQAGAAVNGPLPESASALNDDKALIERALRERLDVRMASLDIDAAAQEIKHQERAALPSVSLGIDGERPDLRAPKTQTTLASRIATLETAATSPSQALRDSIVQRIDDARQRKFDKAQAVDLLLGPSLQITLPVFDQNRAQTAKARFLFTQKQKEYEELLLTVVQEVRQAAAGVRAAEELMRTVTQEALPLSEKNVGTAQRIYEAGEQSILTLLLAQQNFNAQREARIKIAGDYAVARAELERVLGGQPIPETEKAMP